MTSDKTTIGAKPSANLSAAPNAAPSLATVSAKNRSYEWLVRTTFIDGRPMVLVERRNSTDVEAVFENSELGNYLADELCEHFNKRHVRI